MTQLFTSARRIEVLENIKTFLLVDEHIAGLILVGSSASKKQDTYAGVDLIVVIKNGAVFPSIYLKWRERIITLFPVMFHFERSAGDDRAVFSMLLHDYLEINLFFCRVQNLTAEAKPWRVIFDQTETQDIAAILDATYNAERVAAPTRVYQHMMSAIWQPVLKCVVAMNRGETWRALYMLDQLRDQTIQVAAMNYEVDTANYAEVDLLPEMLLIQLRHTIPTALSNVAIRRALRATMTVFFEQSRVLEKTVELRLADETEKRLMSYIEAYA